MSESSNRNGRVSINADEETDAKVVKMSTQGKKLLEGTPSWNIGH